MSSSILLAAFVLLLSIPSVPAAGEIDTLESVPDLEKAMYVSVDGYPCVRLLNISGEIGCSNPGRGKIVAPIRRLVNSNDQLTQLSAVLVPLNQMQSFLFRVSSDQHFAQRVAGVLVESISFQNMSSGFSPDEKFPQARFAPYQNISYEWNPTGSGIMWKQYNFPVFLLSERSTSVVQEIARRNEKGNNVYPVNVAEFDLVMQTTSAGTHDSESCLKEHSCLPLGGYSSWLMASMDEKTPDVPSFVQIVNGCTKIGSQTLIKQGIEIGSNGTAANGSVWSSLPPINSSSRKPPKPIILALASQDSASFFRDRSFGADSPLSGLIALLAAVDALSHVGGLDELEKQIVFAVFTGEAWGYLGSRRFLVELDTASDTVYGLRSTMIQQILEIGSVGKGLDQGSTTFFGHAEGDSVPTKEILGALKRASVSLGSNDVMFKKADASNPGIPPSSLMSFLKKNSSISGVVLEEFGASFTNEFYHSHLDNPSNINTSSIAAAAALVSRALYILATGDSTVNLIMLNSIKVNVSLVEELVGCMLTCEPGLSCDIVKRFISPGNTCPSHYVGVLLDSPPETQSPQYADDTSRFVWNFLADRTSSSKGNTSSCTGECNNKDELCIGAETESGGRCVISTTRYVPAYSTRLKLEGNTWHIIAANASDPMELVDPVWTESNWDTINLRVYTVQSSSYDLFVLLGGVGITVVTYIAVIATGAYLSKALKRD